jgi:hypothetical protein
VKHIVNSLAELRVAKTPLEVQEGFSQLLRIEYPEEFMRGIMRFLPREEIPRNLSFYIKPLGELGPGFKTQFEHINVKKYQSPLQKTDFDRYHIAQEKLTAFFPTNMHGLPRRPQISGVFIKASLPPGPTSADDLPQFLVEVSAKGLKSTGAGKIYLRFENKGKVQLAKYVLLENIVESAAQKPQWGPSKNLEYLSYQLTIAKPENSLESLVYEQQFQLSNEFQLSLAVSSDGELWSDEKTFAFSYEKGKIKSINEE